MINQKVVYESGNELAAYAAKQINYHVMGYYPITPSTQIAEQLDAMKAEGLHDVRMIAAEGEHSAAGICYGASAAGGRVFNATSANGLLYALEQLPVQSGTRLPMVMNVACRTVSGPLCIKGDHSDIMYTLNSGWIILFAPSPQAVYDMNICGLKIAEKVDLPVIVAFDGFFTSHQKKRAYIFEDDNDVKNFVGQYNPKYPLLDLDRPVSIGSYMNEPDVINNKYQLHIAMEKSHEVIEDVFREYGQLTGRQYSHAMGYKTEDADVIMFILGSSYYTAMEAADSLREKGIKAGVATANVLRPFPSDEIYEVIKNAKTIIVCDRQDSYGAKGGNMTLEIKALLFEKKSQARLISRVYGLGGKDFYEDEAESLFEKALDGSQKDFDYIGVEEGDENFGNEKVFEAIAPERSTPKITYCEYEDGKMYVNGGAVKDTTKMPKRLAPGHGACPGCGIPVNVNLLLKGIEGNVVLLFQTGCGMVVTTCYPKTAFKTPYIHNLFQNGAATLTGVVEMYREKQKRGEMPEGEITFVMVSGDGGMDIGMGSALGAALRNNNIIIFEYDNGGYMNTGYQLSYSTPMGAKSSTSNIGKESYGKTFFHKDTPIIMEGTGIPYIATVAESNPNDFIKKAAKAAAYSRKMGTAYIKALSACPLNWGDTPSKERGVIQAAVDCCYLPLYEIEQGKTRLSYDPEEHGKKVPVIEWLKLMGRTKHLVKPEYSEVVDAIQNEVDRRWQRLRARNDSDIL